MQSCKDGHFSITARTLQHAAGLQCPLIHSCTKVTFWALLLFIRLKTRFWHSLTFSPAPALFGLDVRTYPHFSITALFWYLYLQIWRGDHQHWTVGYNWTWPHNSLVFIMADTIYSHKGTQTELSKRGFFLKTTTTFIIRQFRTFLEKDNALLFFTFLEKRKVIYCKPYVFWTTHFWRFGEVVVANV